MRDKSIDALKGFAAFLVIWGHVLQYASIGDIIAENNILYKIIYSFHMPLFMFLSGYVSWYSLKNKCEMNIIYFIKYRGLQLLVPFFAWGILTEGYVNARSIFILHDLSSFFRSMVDLIIVPANGLWFLWVLFFINIFHKIIERVLKIRGGYCIVAVIAVLFYLFANEKYFAIGQMKWMIPFYVLGYYSKNNEKILSNKPIDNKINCMSIIMLPISIAIVAICQQSQIVPLEFTSVSILWKGINYVIRFVIALDWIAFFMLHRNIFMEDKKNIFVKLGGYSLDLYSIQVFPTKMCGKISLWADNIFILNFVFVPIISVAITILCLLVSVYIIRQSKILKLIFIGAKD